MSDRTLTISLSDGTVQALQQSGFRLYVFRVLASSNKSGVPLVWARVDSYIESIVLGFSSTAFASYVSTDAIAVDAPIVMGATAAVGAGQVVSVAVGGGLTVANGAPTGDVYIASAASACYTCGLAAGTAGMSMQPFCAFTLYPQVAVTMQPADAIFVMWATSEYDPSVYMQRSLGPGLLIAFDGAPERAVSYDIVEGWGPADADWAYAVETDADLTAILVLDPGPNHPTKF
jgi:hypothetical protein